jgi:hypothetical protein
MVPFPDVSKLSAIAGELERRFPAASVGEIYAMAKPTVEGAVAVAAGNSRNEGIVFILLLLTIASSVLFSNPILGDTTPKSVQNQGQSARHTPVQQETPFRTPSALPPQPQPSHQPIHTHRHHENPPYDMETWFSTFPGPTTDNAGPSTSTDFTQFQPIQVLFHFVDLTFRMRLQVIRITLQTFMLGYSNVRDMYSPRFVKN